LPFEPRAGVKLTRERQWFWFRQLVLSYFGHADFDKFALEEMEFIKNAWRGITRVTPYCVTAKGRITAGTPFEV
jgi:hypothetical protein